MIEELFLIEKDAYRDSVIHRLDARVKILTAFAAIIALVAFPYSTMVYGVGAIFALFAMLLWLLSHLSFRVYLLRIVAIIPVWGVIIFFQIFLKNGFYTEYHALATFPFGIAIYAESIEFAFILFAKFFACISFIILLSSTTKMQDLLNGAQRLGLPAEFALPLGMMIRYLFVFGYMYRKINQTLEVKCFDPFDSRLPYRYRIRQLGYTIGTLFIRSYEQGEQTYIAMLCRGYGKHSHIFVKKKPLGRNDVIFLVGSFSFILFVPLYVFFTRMLP
jgi:cobalt/nickel transport system permease protein